MTRYCTSLKDTVLKTPATDDTLQRRGCCAVERDVFLRDPVWLRVSGDQGLPRHDDVGRAPKATGERVLPAVGISRDQVLNTGRGGETERVDALIIVARNKEAGALGG
jgi:hypothetical protein